MLFSNFKVKKSASASEARRGGEAMRVKITQHALTRFCSIYKEKYVELPDNPHKRVVFVSKEN